MIFISQGHFTFELTLAGLLEDILTRYKNERVLLSLSDPAIGIQGQLFIADSTIFAARVERPPIEGYAALRNLCQFAGAEYSINKLDPTEPDPTTRAISIDLAKLIKIVPSLPVDPSSLVSSEALMTKMPVSSVVGAPVVVAVPPMQLPTLPPPGSDFPQADERSSTVAKKRIDQAFEAALQKRAASKGSPGGLDHAPGAPAQAQPAAPAPGIDPGSGMSKLAQAAALLASSPSPASPAFPVSSAEAQPTRQTASMVPVTPEVALPNFISVAQPPAPQPYQSKQTSSSTRVAKAEPTSAPEGEQTPAQPVVYQNAVGLGTGEIDWHAVRESAKKVESVSKEPTIAFSLADQIQQELASHDEVEEVAEPLKRQALKKTFVGPLAAVRFFTGSVGRLVLPVAVIVVIFQGGKLWMESHGGTVNFKIPDLLGKPAKPAPHKEVAKPAHTGQHHEVTTHHEVSTHHEAPQRSSSHAFAAKTAASHAASAKNAPATKESVKNVASKAASQDASGSAKPQAANSDKIVGTGSSKYPNSLIMREHIKPMAPLPPKRHAYQTAPDAGSGGDE